MPALEKNWANNETLWQPDIIPQADAPTVQNLLFNVVTVALASASLFIALLHLLHQRKAANQGDSSTLLIASRPTTCTSIDGCLDDEPDPRRTPLNIRNPDVEHVRRTIETAIQLDASHGDVELENIERVLGDLSDRATAPIAHGVNSEPSSEGDV